MGCLAQCWVVQVTAMGMPSRDEMNIQEVWKSENFSGRQLGR